MSTTDPRLHRIRCSAKSLCQTRNSCAHKELQSHGVEDGSKTCQPVHQLMEHEGCVRIVISRGRFTELL